ncbi:MAG: pyrroline-5-carboxylate reductase [Kiloniellales bacterium]
MTSVSAVKGPLLLVGCGKMGGALLEGWQARGLAASDAMVVEPMAPAHEALAGRGIAAVAAADELPGGFRPRVVVLAIKPQQLDATIGSYRRFVDPQTAFLSIIAGKKLAGFAAALGDEAAVVRAMPNTPAAVGRGISVLVANARVSDRQRADCSALLAAVGETAWVEDEGLLDPVTAVSGGGPAYVFLLAECLETAGIEAGLPAGLAARLARATVAGSGELLRQARESPAKLRENVSSPGGTTLEALKVLRAPDGLEGLMIRAVAEATRRSRELAS